MVRKPAFFLSLMLGFLLLAACDTTGPTPTPVPTATVNLANISSYLDDVMRFRPNPTLMPNGENPWAETTITNTDTISHQVNVQANFYSVPLSKLGPDPADYLVTAGYVNILLDAGAHKDIHIDAKNNLGDKIVSVDFSTIGK